MGVSCTLLHIDIKSVLYFIANVFSPVHNFSVVFEKQMTVDMSSVLTHN